MSKPTGRVAVNPELFARTAPRWNCVDFPNEGMHSLNHAGGCTWCGMTRQQITQERSNATATENQA